jgi:hypothetical protein
MPRLILAFGAHCRKPCCQERLFEFTLRLPMQKNYEIMSEKSLFLYRTHFPACKDYLCEVLSQDQIQNRTECEWGKRTTYAIYVAPEDKERAQKILTQQLIHLVELGESASDAGNRRLILISAIFVAILVVLTYIIEHR